MARRRRKSGFSSSNRGGRLGLALPVVAGIAAVAGIVYLVHVSDSDVPKPQETRIELPNAFK